MKFDKQNLAMIRKDINDALAVISEMHGITLEFKNITYDDNTFRTTLRGHSGDAKTAAKSEFIKYAWKFGLKDTAFNKQIKLDGKTYIINGIKPRSTKYPVLAKLQGTDKVFKLPLSAIPTKHKR